MHGLGDAGTNPGMQSLAQHVAAAFPGMYATSISVADGAASIFTLIDKQVDEFAAAVRADPKLAGGFNGVGLSQGGLILRAYVQKYNQPPVHNLVSICGPQNGVGTCPSSVPGFVCSLFELGPYTAQLSFAGYWKEVKNETAYLSSSTFLADVNNERAIKSALYAKNMASLNAYVTVMALNDTVVIVRPTSRMCIFCLDLHDFANIRFALTAPPSCAAERIGAPWLLGVGPARRCGGYAADASIRRRLDWSQIARFAGPPAPAVVRGRTYHLAGGLVGCSHHAVSEQHAVNCFLSSARSRSKCGAIGSKCCVNLKYIFIIDWLVCTHLERRLLSHANMHEGVLRRQTERSKRENGMVKRKRKNMNPRNWMQEVEMITRSMVDSKDEEKAKLVVLKHKVELVGTSVSV